MQLGWFSGTEHPSLMSSVSDPQFLRPGWASQTKESEFPQLKNENTFCLNQHLLPRKMGGWVGKEFFSLYVRREERRVRTSSIPVPKSKLSHLGVSNAPANEMLRVVVLSLGGLADNKFLYVKKLTTHLPQNVNPMKIKTLSDKKNKGCRNITMFFL